MVTAAIVPERIRGLTSRKTLCYHPASRPSRHMTANLLPAEPPPIDALIERCLRGDQAAWEQIVRQHWRKVFNVAYKFVGTPRRRPRT